MNLFFIKLLFLFVVLLFVFHCREYQYFNDMHYSEAVDAQKKAKIGGRLGNIIPPENTVSYKNTPYTLSNAEADYILADNQLKSPFQQVTSKTLNQGKEQYRIYCSPCHGIQGKGDGLVQKKANWSAVRPLVAVEGKEVPSLKWGVGRLYHVIRVGIRSMSGYEAQIREKNRWAIAHYVKYLQTKVNQ